MAIITGKKSAKIIYFSYMAIPLHWTKIVEILAHHGIWSGFSWVKSPLFMYIYFFKSIFCSLPYMKLFVLFVNIFIMTYMLIVKKHFFSYSCKIPKTLVQSSVIYKGSRKKNVLATKKKKLCMRIYLSYLKTKKVPFSIKFEKALVAILFLQVFLFMNIFLIK